MGLFSRLFAATTVACAPPASDDEAFARAREQMVTEQIAARGVKDAACANANGSGLGIDGATTCATALSNTAIAAGDWLELASGTAGGTAKRMSITVTYTVNQHAEIRHSGIIRPATGVFATFVRDRAPGPVIGILRLAHVCSLRLLLEQWLCLLPHAYRQPYAGSRDALQLHRDSECRASFRARSERQLL